MVSPYLNKPVRSLDQVLKARADTLDRLDRAPAERAETAPERTVPPRGQPGATDTLPAPRRAA